MAQLQVSAEETARAAPGLFWEFISHARQYPHVLPMLLLLTRPVRVHAGPCPARPEE